jgi:hypothetical protein
MHSLGMEFSDSVAKGPKFRPQSSKRAEKILWGRESQGPKFYPIYQKRAEKGPNFFLGVVFHKIIYIYCQKLGL